MNRAATEKSFDCVKFMREARGRIDAATAGMSDVERLEWYKSREYTDPWLAGMSRGLSVCILSETKQLRYEAAARSVWRFSRQVAGEALRIQRHSDQGYHMTATLTGEGGIRHSFTIPRHRDLRFGTLDGIVTDVVEFV